MNRPESALLHRLLNRPRDSHKYDFGRVLVIGGSQPMAGAPVLAGKAALRSGAGVVELCVPDCVVSVAAGFDPCLITHGLPSDDSGCFSPDGMQAMRVLAVRADVVVCGPGLGRSPALAPIVAALWRELPQSMVVDADALYALSGLDAATLAQHGGERILTPHAGEMGRLLGLKAGSKPDRSALEQAAAEFARQVGAVVVLKGQNSLVADGERLTHNASGNSGMATAGTGDVLSGIIAALLAQKLTPGEAARIGVRVHGLAGDAAAKALGELALTANDLIDFLPEIWQQLRLQTNAGFPA
jgi:NAD(P)H-hydrate epimerase